MEILKSVIPFFFLPLPFSKPITIVLLTKYGSVFNHIRFKFR